MSLERFEICKRVRLRKSQIALNSHVLIAALGQKAVDKVKAKTKGGKITLLEMDNESLASVRKAAQSFLSQSKTLNILVNNAGLVSNVVLHSI